MNSAIVKKRSPRATVTLRDRPVLSASHMAAVTEAIQDPILLVTRTVLVQKAKIVDRADPIAVEAAADIALVQKGMTEARAVRTTVAAATDTANRTTVVPADPIAVEAVVDIAPVRKEMTEARAVRTTVAVEDSINRMVLAQKGMIEAPADPIVEAAAVDIVPVLKEMTEAPADPIAAAEVVDIAPVRKGMTEARAVRTTVAAAMDTTNGTTVVPASRMAVAAAIKSPMDRAGKAMAEASASPLTRADAPL